MSEVPTTEAEWLRDQAEVIRAMPGLTSTAVVRIGCILIEAKNRLGHGRFLPWVAAEFRWHRSPVNRMMKAGRIFADLPAETLRQFSPSALYALANHHVPAPVRAKVIAEATGGKSFKEWEVKARVAAAAGAEPRSKRRAKKSDARTSGDSTGNAVYTEDVLVSLLTAGAEVTFSQRAGGGSGRGWVCRVSYGDGTPTEFVSTVSAFAALALAGPSPPQVSRHPAKSKEGKRERREAVERYLMANPLAKRKTVADALQVTQAFVQRVQQQMGGYFARPRAEVVKDRVNEMLRADPTTSDGLIAERLQCCASLVRMARYTLEEFHGLPKTTTRYGRNGREIAVTALPTGGSIEDLKAELAGA